MNRFTLAILCCLFLVTCKPGIPSDIIQPDDMALVLNDIHIVDGYITTVRPDSSKIIAASLYKGIYKKFGVDSAKYYKSMDYYYKNPSIMDGIYKKVNAGLLKQQSKLVKMDSLKNAKIEAKVKLKAKADSTKAADSLKKVVLKKKTDSLNKIKAKKRIDSVKKSKLIMKVKPKSAKRTTATKPAKI
jgi:F420-0:gamma-glutamyl ligase-like protein